MTSDSHSSPLNVVVVSDAMDEIDAQLRAQGIVRGAAKKEKPKAVKEKKVWKKAEEEKFLQKLIRIEPPLYAEIQKFQVEESYGSFTEAAKAVWRKGLKAHRSEKARESVPVKMPDGMIFKQGPNGVILAADNG